MKLEVEVGQKGRLRALRDSKARHLRALRIRGANGTGPISTEITADNNNNDPIYKENNVLIEPRGELILLSEETHTEIIPDNDYYTDYMAVSPSSLSGGNNNNQYISLSPSSLSGGNNNNNYMPISPSSLSGDNNNTNNTELMSLSAESAKEKVTEELNTMFESISCKASESTQKQITEELNKLLESSGQASTEIVDYGCEIMKAATNSIEFFFQGPTTRTTNEIVSTNHVIIAPAIAIPK